MKSEDILTIVEDLQRESMNCMSAEFMACLDVVHKYVERESERDREIARLKTKGFVADRSFNRYKESVAI